MEFERETTRLLHDEHMAALALLERLEGLLGRHGPRAAPDVGESLVNLLLGDLVATLETETVEHFRFEEETVFPRLAEAGDGTLGHGNQISEIRRERRHLQGRRANPMVQIIAWRRRIDGGMALRDLNISHRHALTFNTFEKIVD